MTRRAGEWIAVTGLYLLLTIVMTWPVAAGLSSDVPSDLGDSLLNMWILGWGAEQLPRVLAGSLSFRDYWNANIFHPEPLTLGLSEHLTGQVVQILPVYHLTGNLILCYNLLFLSSFALSGLAMYLLVRDLTGSRPAALLAGLFYAFVPVRISQIAHLQVIGSQWMPLALFGFRRFIVSDRPAFGRHRLAALAGGAAALLMQNLSNGYYLIYFAPFVALFVLHQMFANGRHRDVRVWIGFAAAAALVIGGTAPFLLMYLETQRAHGIDRPLGELIGFSADMYGYLTASGYLRLWGQVLQAAPKPEGEVFLGFMPMLFGAVTLVLGALSLRRPNGGDFHADTVDAATARGGTPERWKRVAIRVFAVIALVQTTGFFAVLLTGGFVSYVGFLPIRASNAGRLLMQALVALLALMLLSPVTLERVRRVLRSPVFLMAALTLLAVVLSLGPVPMALGRQIPGLGLYRWLFEHVPGFAGLRVPARLAMIAALFLIALAGFGAAHVFRRWRHGPMMLAAAAVFFVAESIAVPLPVNSSWGGLVSAPARVYPPESAPRMYRALAELPADVVIAEFPFGDITWELRYVYYSTVHWRRILNGYSGTFPQGYKLRVARLARVPDAPADAWQTLLDSGATHVVVHEAAYPEHEADRVKQWLAAMGAVPVSHYESDGLYALPSKTTQ